MNGSTASVADPTFVMLAEARAMQGDLERIRRTLHRIPEVGLVLPETQQAVLRELAGLDLEIRLGQDATSVIAILRGGQAAANDAPVIVLRSDMDGLPVVERSGEPFSATGATMHACGHDLHMAMMIGAARILHARRAELLADIAFVFQPGEEGHGGAALTLADPALTDILDRAIATYSIHVQARVPAPSIVGTRAGTIMSGSSDLEIVLRGRGGHGSTPHETVDPMPAAATTVLALQSLVTRRFDVFDPVVISVGMIKAGTAFNVIPESVTIGATVRYLSIAARTVLENETERIARSIGDAHGLEAEVAFREINPPTVNDRAEADFVLRTARDLLGEDRSCRLDHPLMQSEDYSLFLQRVPGAMVLIGAAPPGEESNAVSSNHAPDVRFDDSRLFEGAALLSLLTLRRAHGIAAP